MTQWRNSPNLWDKHKDLILEGQKEYAKRLAAGESIEVVHLNIPMVEAKTKSYKDYIIPVSVIVIATLSIIGIVIGIFFV